jgi:hypothetical protein
MRDEKPIGRFYISASAAFKNGTPELVYVLNLTVRGLAAGDTEEDIIAFMDYGRDLIVHTFRDITTDEMHSEWGLK